MIARMAKQEHPKFIKEEYLAQRLHGKTRLEIAKANGYTLPMFEHHVLRRWGIKDPQQEELALIDASRMPVRGLQALNERNANQPEVLINEAATKEAQENTAVLEESKGSSGHDNLAQEAPQVNVAADYTGSDRLDLIALNLPPSLFVSLDIPLQHFEISDRDHALEQLEARLEDMRTALLVPGTSRRVCGRELLQVIRSFVGLIVSDLADLVGPGEVPRLTCQFFERLISEARNG